MPTNACHHSRFSSNLSNWCFLSTAQKVEIFPLLNNYLHVESRQISVHLVFFLSIEFWKKVISSLFYFRSGSTIVGVGSPDPPQFIYDEEDYKDVFLSGKSELLVPFISQFRSECYVFIHHCSHDYLSVKLSPQSLLSLFI